MRRWTRSPYADNYQTILAFDADGETRPPHADERSLDDHISPQRSGSITRLVNGASTHVSSDVAAWSYHRILALVGQLDRSGS